MKLPLLRSLVSLAAAAGGISIASAQVSVTNITYGTLIDSGDVTNGGVTYREKFAPVSTVTTGIGNYQFTGPMASAVVTRRNTTQGNSNNTTLFQQTDTGTVAQGEYETNISNLWRSNNLYEGLRNPFANGNNSDESNIERFDFNLTNYVVQANDALVFFDFENSGNLGDGFRIAAFTATGTVNGFANAPTTYANNGLLVGADAFGGPINSPTGGTSGTFERITYTNGDNLNGTASDIQSINGAYNLVGILIRFSDLGIAAGTTIQGFSLMAADVTPTTAANLSDWNNTTYYKNNTDAGGVGNMDFMAFGAQIARPVPEPSTYGAIFVGLALVGWLWRRRQPVLVPVKV